MSQLIKVTTETPSDIPQEYLDKFDISVVPLHVNHDGKDYKDGELTNQYIYDTFREKKILPSTSAVAVGEYRDFFRPFLAEGKTIIHVAMSSGISSTYQNACIAAEDLEEEGKVYVIDSKKLSLATAVLVFKGAEMAENGMAAEDIVAALEDMVPKVDNTFIITTLEFLRHGGRCSAMEAFGANLLKLKPMINMVDGSMEVEKKYRTYAPTADMDGFAASRTHRGIGGFSMGSVTTWYAFQQALSCFGWFLPLSGDSWIEGRRGGVYYPETTAIKLAKAVAQQGYTPEDYLIYCITGSKDIAWDAVDAQIHAMEKQEEFRFGTNIFYGLKQEGWHSVEEVRHYAYHALPDFFAE